MNYYTRNMLARFTKKLTNIVTSQASDEVGDDEATDEANDEVSHNQQLTTATANKELSIGLLHEDIFDRFKVATTSLLYSLLSHEPEKMNDSEITLMVSTVVSTTAAVSAVSVAATTATDKLTIKTAGSSSKTAKSDTVKSNTVSNFTNDDDTSKFNDSLLLQRYLRAAEPWPLSKSLDMQKVVLASYFRKLVKNLASLDVHEANLVNQIWLDTEWEFDLLIYAVNNKNLLLTMYSQKSFAALYAVYQPYLKKMVDNIRRLLEVLWRLHRQHGIVRFRNQSHDRTGDIKEINYLALHNKLQEQLKQLNHRLLAKHC